METANKTLDCKQNQSQNPQSNPVPSARLALSLDQNVGGCQRLLLNTKPQHNPNLQMGVWPSGLQWLKLTFVGSGISAPRWRAKHRITDLLKSHTKVAFTPGSLDFFSLFSLIITWLFDVLVSPHCILQYSLSSCCLSLIHSVPEFPCVMSNTMSSSATRMHEAVMEEQRESEDAISYNNALQGKLSTARRGFQIKAAFSIFIGF